MTVGQTWDTLAIKLKSTFPTELTSCLTEDGIIVAKADSLVTLGTI